MEKLINIIFKCSIVFFISLLIFFFFELFLIWENYYQPFKNPYNLKTKNYQYSFYIKENQLNNSMKTKVFVLGDSMVSGSACAGKKENITGHLNNFANQSIKQNINFINLGKEGLTVTNYIDVLENITISKKDKVVVFLFENDIHINNEVCLIAKNQQSYLDINYPKSCDAILAKEIITKNNNTLLKKINNLLFNFKTYKIIKEGLVNTPYINSLFYRTEFRKLWSDYKSEENLFIVSSINALKEIVETKGSEFYLGYYPLTNNISINHPQHKRWLKFINYLKINQKIYLFDPYPFLIKNTDKNNMVWSLSDKHPSCSAHKLVAEYLFTEVIL